MCKVKSCFSLKQLIFYSKVNSVNKQFCRTILCPCGCLYVCVSVYVYIYVYVVYVYECTYMCVYVCICVWVYVTVGTDRGAALGHDVVHHLPVADLGGPVCRAYDLRGRLHRQDLGTPTILCTLAISLSTLTVFT